MYGMKKYMLSIAVLTVLLFVSCSDDSNPDEPGYEPIPYTLELPPIFDRINPPSIPSDNPLTEEGVALGKKLFFDPILSGDNTLACAGCHKPANAFTDDATLSIGIDGEEGIRNSMPLFNLAWNTNDFFWDGAANTLEKQVLEPVANPVEMHEDWENAVAELAAHPQYPEMFSKSFGTSSIDRDQVAKAIAQFMRTMVSGNSRFDKYLLGELELTESELNGFDIFMDEDRGDCFHCHGNPFNPLWTDNQYHNNGLDETFDDRGRGLVTGDPMDFGKFRSPSLRNLAYTAPYMHDGRFETLDEVIDHYSEGLVYSETIDPLMKAVAEGGVQLTTEQKEDLKAFLLSLSDPSFINNPDFQN